MQGGSPNKQTGSTGWFVVVAIAVAIFVLIKLSEAPSKTSEPLPFASSVRMPSEDGKVASPPEMTTLAGGDLKAARGAFSKIAALDDPTSAMVYSKNCYVALSGAFSWSKLDRCGTFDAIIAGQVVSDAMLGSAEELAYFESEATAQRYLAAGIASGGAPSVMDQRWEALGSFARGVAEKAIASTRAAEVAAEALQSDGLAAGVQPAIGEVMDSDGAEAESTSTE